MSKCLDCKNCVFVVEPHEKTDFEGNHYIDYSNGHYHCRYNYKKFDTNKEIQCKRFKERKFQCRVCKKMVPMSEFGGITCGDKGCVEKAKSLFGEFDNGCY